MKPYCRRLLERCVGDGICGGFNKAMKYSEKGVDEQTEQQIKDQIEHYIWLEIDEAFNFDDELEKE